MKFKLKANSEVDLASPAEMRGMLEAQTKDWWEERARGVQPGRGFASGVPAAGALSLPASGDNPVGPRPGYAWGVYRISVDGLASGDSIKVYRTSVTGANYLVTLTATTPFLLVGKGLVLRGGEQLLFTGASLTATGTITLTCEAQEVPDVDINKLY